MKHALIAIAMLVIFGAVGGCTRGGNTYDPGVTAWFGNHKANAQSATANMIYVRPAETSAEFQLDHWKFKVDQSRVWWAGNGELTLPNSWKQIQFVDQGDVVKVVIDGRRYGGIRPRA